MGDRYFLTVVCPNCSLREENVYYAPTCGIVDYACKCCGKVIDLEELTGITYEDASNLKKIQAICDAVAQKYEGIEKESKKTQVKK